MLNLNVSKWFHSDNVIESSNFANTSVFCVEKDKFCEDNFDFLKMYLSKYSNATIKQTFQIK